MQWSKNSNIPPKHLQLYLCLVGLLYSTADSQPLRLTHLSIFIYIVLSLECKNCGLARWTGQMVFSHTWRTWREKQSVASACVLPRPLLDSPCSSLVLISAVLTSFRLTFIIFCNYVQIQKLDIRRKVNKSTVISEFVAETNSPQCFPLH